MNDSFLIQAGLWGTATGLSALATTQYLNFKRKERNLPAACEFEALETELALKRSQLRDANETIGRAQIVLSQAEETRRWLSEQKAELVRIEADRKAQEGLRAEIITQTAKLESLMAELSRAGKDVAAEEAKVVSLASQKAELTASVSDLNTRFTKCIRETIENLVPTEDILNTYLTLPEEDTNLDVEHDGYHEEEQEEERPDVGEALDAVDNIEQEQVADDAPPAGTIQPGELPEPVETPGGTKTVAVTPAPAAPHRESLFPDAPEVGKKALEE